jgi:hypothetical protein
VQRTDGAVDWDNYFSDRPNRRARLDDELAKLRAGAVRVDSEARALREVSDAWVEVKCSGMVTQRHAAGRPVLRERRMT